MRWILDRLLIVVLAAVAVVAAARAEQRDTFEVGTIWEGGAWFESDGSFGNCYLYADFPEGWIVGFYLYPDRTLQIEFDEPDIGINVDPTVSIQIDGREIAYLQLWVDEEILFLEDWLLVYGDLGRIESFAPAIRSGGRMTVVFRGEDSNGVAGTWTFSAALTGSDLAFADFERCIDRYAGLAPTGSGFPLPAPARRP